MPVWNPWRGCKKCSEGCEHCYIHKGDAKRGVNTGWFLMEKCYEIKFHPAALKEFCTLDGSVKNHRNRKARGNASLRSCGRADISSK